MLDLSLYLCSCVWIGDNLTIIAVNWSFILYERPYLVLDLNPGIVASAFLCFFSVACFLAHLVMTLCNQALSVVWCCRPCRREYYQFTCLNW